MDLLHKLKDSSHHGVAKSCNGALWVLNMDIKVKQGESAAGVIERWTEMRGKCMMHGHS